jgi:hypothetical protein
MELKDHSVIAVATEAVDDDATPVNLALTEPVSFTIKAPTIIPSEPTPPATPPTQPVPTTGAEGLGGSTGLLAAFFAMMLGSTLMVGRRLPRRSVTPYHARRALGEVRYHARRAL